MKYQVIATIAICCLASACNRKAEGQTVAVVNGQEITIPDLNFALEMARVPDTADKKTVRSQVLQQLIDRRLLAEQARKDGIDKTPEFLNRERRADEDLLISMLAARRLNTAQLPSDREIQTFIASHPGMFANREMWNLDQLEFSTPTDQNIVNEIRKTNSIDGLISVLQKYKIAYKRQNNRLDTAVVPPDLYAKLSTLPAGEPFVVPVGNLAVASAIIGREPRPVTGDKAKPTAVDAMRKMQTTKSLQDLLKSLKDSAKIEYQPGYAPPPKKS